MAITGNPESTDKEKDYKKAVEDLRKALKNNPDHPGVNENKWLAFSKKEKRRHGKKSK